MATISNNEIKIKYSLDTTDLANATALFDRLSAEDRQLLNDLKRLQAQLNATGQAGQAAGQNIGNGITNARSKTKGLLDDFVQMQNPIKQIGVLIATAFSVQSLYRFGRSVLDTTIKFESLRKAIEFTSGTMTQGIINFQFLEKIAKELGLPLEAAAQGFKSFSAAAQRAGITMEQQQVMFTDLSKAMAALQVTSADAQLIFFGFSQLMSKAKVSAQELYHQIGERLPLGMEAAQIAVGRMTGQTKVSTSELMKMVETGKLLSEEFAPEFTKALGELAGDAAKVETLGKSFTRLGDAWDKMLYSMGESNKGWFKETLDGFASLFDQIGQYFKGFNAEVEFVQTNAFDNAVKKAEKMSTESIQFRLDILEKQKEVAQKEVDAIQQTFAQLDAQRKMISIGGKDFLGITPEGYNETKDKLEAARLALAKLQGTADAYIKTLKERQPIVTEKEIEDGKKLENEYKKIIAAIEARKTAEDNRIKASTRDGYTRDVQLLKNNVKFNEEMLAIDESKRFKELELAKNNAVKRRGENARDNQEQINIRKKALDEALKIEEQYLNKSNDKVDESIAKRRQARQTELQNQLEDIKKNGNEQADALAIELNKAISVQELSEKDRLEIIKRFDGQITKIRQDNLNQQLFALQKYYDDQEALDEQAAFDRNEIYAKAATRRLAADAKNEYDRQDILDQGALAEITNEKNRLKAQEQRLKTAYGLSVEYRDREAAMIKAKLAELDAEEYEIKISGQLRQQQKMLEIVQATADAMSQIFNDLTNLYISNLDREKEALNQKYEADVRLADGNKQKLAQLAQEKARKEYEIELKQFKARQLMAVAEVIFKTAPEIAKWIATGVLAPVAAIGLAAQAFAIGAILSQPPPVPPYKDGTKGRPHPGGPALVGEAGTEKVITTDGQVYFTPPMATLVDLPKGAQVIPNHALSRKELFMANALNQGKPINPGDNLGPKLDRIGGILESLPVHQVNMNEKGFEKFVRTPRRTTRILNNQFPVKH